MRIVLIRLGKQSLHWMTLLALLWPLHTLGSRDDCKAVFYEPLTTDEYNSILIAQAAKDVLLLPAEEVDQRMVYNHAEVLLGKLAASSNLNDEQRIHQKYALLSSEQIELLNARINDAVGQLIHQSPTPSIMAEEERTFEMKLLRLERVNPEFVEGIMGPLPDSIMVRTKIPLKIAKKALQRVIHGRIDYYQNLNLMDPLVLNKIHKFQVALQDLAEESLRKTLQAHGDPSRVEEELQRWAGFFEKWVDGSSLSQPYNTEFLFCRGRALFILDRCATRTTIKCCSIWFEPNEING